MEAPPLRVLLPALGDGGLFPPEDLLDDGPVRRLRDLRRPPVRLFRPLDPSGVTGHPRHHVSTTLCYARPADRTASVNAASAARHACMSAVVPRILPQPISRPWASLTE
ncbi:hypothetical protein [Pseudonocardia adelaidensis]|uniref:Uncharacterized protein n=1 Tax=Pseudonocardia adelaidensis TaxID=648754 RepID=A0ABP9NTG3_9PSEU